MARSSASEPVVDRICLLLRGTVEGEIATIRAIDNALSQHLTGGTAAPRLALLADLLRRGVASLREMGGVSHRLISDGSGLLSRLAAEWIAEDEGAMVAAVYDLVSTSPSKPPALDLDFSSFALDRRRTASIACRVASRFIILPATAISILLALLRSGHPAAADEIEALILDPLLISYWRAGRAALVEAELAQPPEVRTRIQRLLAEIDAHAAAIRGVGIIRELAPPERQRFLQQVLRSERQREMEKDVRSRSIFADIIPTSVLLYGDSAVSDVHLGDGTIERREFRLGVVEHSMDVATMDAIDPVGFRLQRLVLSKGERP